MTRFDDELEYVCAWGRWRIDQARNDSVLPAERRLAPLTPERVVVRVLRTQSGSRIVTGTPPKAAARKAFRRGRARLRLVTSVGTPAETGAAR